MAQASNLTRRPSLAKKVMARAGIHIKPSHKGLLHKKLHVPEDEPIPSKKLSKALKSSSPALRKEANFARNAKHFKH